MKPPHDYVVGERLQAAVPGSSSMFLISTAISRQHVGLLPLACKDQKPVDAVGGRPTEPKGSLELGVLPYSCTTWWSLANSHT